MLAGANATLNTLQGFDSLDGMGGADTLNAQLYANGAALSVTPSATDNLEVIKVAASSDNNARGVTLNLLNAGQVTNVVNTGSTDSLTFSQIAAGADLAVQDTAGSTVFNYATTAGLQSADLALTNVQAGGTQTITDVETVNVTSSGSSNNTTLAGGATTINVAGSADLNLNAVAASVTHLHAEGFAGDLTANITNQVSSATASSVHGGLGDDVFTSTAAAGNGTVASELNGGLGANQLRFNVADDGALVNANSIAITNIGTVRATMANDLVDQYDQSLNAALVGGLTTVDMYANDLTTANTLTVTNLTADQRVNVVEATSGAVVDVARNTETGTADTVKVGLASTAGLATQVTFNQVNTGIETLQILSNGQSYGDVEVENTFTNIEISGGAAGKTLVLGGTGAIVATTVNGSSLTSNLDVNVGAAASTLTGGAGNDIFRFGANLGATDSVDGGAGTNTVAFTAQAGLISATLNNVQNLNVLAAAGAGNFSANNTSGVTTINVTSGAATNGAGFTNLQSTTNAVNVLDSAGDVSARYAAGVTTAATVAIGDAAAATVAVDVDNLTVNNGAALTINSVATGATNSVSTTLATNATSLTLNSVATSILDIAGAVTADSATTVTVNGNTANVSVDGANSFDSLTNLVIAAAAGADVLFNGDVAPAGAATVASIDLSATGTGSLVDLSTGASQLDIIAGAASTNATVTSLVVTNGAGADVTADINLDALSGAGGGTGVASVGTVSITNNGTVVGDTVALNLDLVSDAAAGTQGIGTLNVTAGGASLTTLNIDVTGSDDLSPTISAGTLSGSGAFTLTTTAATAINLSALTTTDYTGTLTITGDGDLATVVGSNVADTISGLDLAASVTGGLGADLITLQNDTTDVSHVIYLNQASSTGTVYDYITNFDLAGLGAGDDLIDISALGLLGGTYGAAPAGVTVTVGASATTFTVTAAAAPTLFAANTAIYQNAANSVILIDANLSGGWEAASDMAIVLVGVANAAGADIVF